MAEIASFGVNVDQNTRLAQNAQDTANTANGGVNNINDPNKLAPAEKATLKRKYDTDVLLYGMDTKKLTDNQLSTSEIDSAMNALTAYMTPFFANMTSTDTVDRGTLNTVYKNFDTADKDSDSAFTNMVSNTASDALSAGNQAKKAGSEAVVAGNQASEAANNAAAQASVAVSKANVAQSSVATAIAKAGFANDTASTASQAANDAKTIASQAANNVAIAKNDAANALTSAASAQNVASSAVATANSTASDFGKVSQKTDSALTSAVNAQSAASDAVKQASSAAADSKDAKQIAGAVSQSYKTLTDGSTMTIAELQNGLAAKLTKTDLDGYATQTWTQNQIKVTADGINGTMSSIKSTVDGQTTSINDLKADSSSFKSQFTTVNNTLGKQNTDIGTLQATSKSLSANFDSLSSDNKTNQHDIGQLQASAKGFSSTLETVKTQVQDSAVGTNLAIGTNQEYAMGWGIPNTSWTDGYAYLKLPLNTTAGEILPQFPHDFWYVLNQGVTYTQTIWFETDATVKDLSAAQITWYVTGVGHDYQPASVQKLGQNSYKLVSTYTWPGKSNNNVRLFDIENLSSAFDLSAGTYLKFGKLKLEKGSLATDWCPNPADNATVTALTQVKQTADGAQVLATNNKGDITNLQATAKGLQTSVSNAATKDQLNILSDTFSNKISSATSAANSKMIQTINNVGIGFTNTDGSKFQMNLSADGTALMDFSKIMLNGQTNIQAATIGNAQIANGAINQAKIANAAVGTAQIANAAITDAKIGNISANHLTAGTIDFNTITGKNINASNITTGTLSTDRLNVGKLSALSANLGDVTTGSLKGVDIVAKTFSTPNGSFTTDASGAITAKNMTLMGGTLTSPKINASTINGSTINGSTINTPNLNMGDDGQIIGNYGVNDSTSYFQPINGTGKLDISHGYIQSTANLIYYNKIMRGMANSWGYWKDSVTFVPEAHLTIGNTAESTLTAGFLKLDIFDQAKTHVVSRAYVDGTGLYINSGGTEAVSSMLSDFELLSSGRAYLMGGAQITGDVQAPSIFATALNITPGQLRLQMVSSGSDWGLQVGSFAGNEAVLSDFIYNSTTSHSANLHITANGHIVRSTSASKYKYNIKHAIDEDSLANKLLTMHISTWNDKHAVDSYAQTLTDNTESEDISIKDNYGLIAEDLRDAGLDMFVEYGKNHTIEGIEYDRAWLPLLPKMRQMNDKINEYELRISKLEAKINE